MDTDAESWVSDRIDAELVLLNVETATDVMRRSDFYCWVQGIFQSLLAHQGLMCGLMCPGSARLTFAWMGGYPISAEAFAEMSDPGSGLCHALRNTWEQAGRVPLALSDDACGDRPPEAAVLLEHMRHMQLTNCLVHGAPGIDGRPAAFFELFSLPTPPGLRERRMLQLLLPHLDAAWLRAMAQEATQANSRAMPIAGVLSAREVEVLKLVGEGHTNKEIADRLAVTKKTVEAHLERIFRKLGVRRRVQAAVKGAQLNLAQGSGPGWRYYS